MDKNRVKGAVNEVVGSARRRAGEVTGDRKTEVAGAAQELKGKVQKVVGKVKDAARDAREDSAASRNAKP